MATPESEDAERLLRLETAVAHLQHDFERLHHVALDLQTELRTLLVRLQRIEERQAQAADPPEIRSPADERPPHW